MPKVDSKRGNLKLSTLESYGRSCSASLPNQVPHGREGQMLNVWTVC